MDRCEDVIDHRPRDDCPAKSSSRSVPARMRLHCPSIRPAALSKMKFLHCLPAARVGRRPSPRGSFARVQCARSRRRCSARPANNFPLLHPSLFLPWSRAARSAPLICAYFSPHRGTQPPPHFQFRLIHSVRSAIGSLKTGGSPHRPGLDLSEIDGYSIFGTH